MIELASDTGMIAYNISQLKRTNNLAVRCHVISQTLNKLNYVRDQLENAGSVRFYEPKEAISIYKKAVSDASREINSDAMQRIIKSCENGT